MKPFWHDRLTHLAKAKTTAYKAWVSAGRPRTIDSVEYANHRSARKEFRRVFRKAESDFYSEIEKKIEGNAQLDEREFWYLLKKKSKTENKIGALKDKDGNIITDKHKIAELWHEHFQTLSRPNDNNSYDSEFKAEVNQCINKHCQDRNEDESDILLNHPVLTDEVKNVCDKLKSGKAPGVDGLQNEHLKYGGITLYKMLACIFTVIIREEYVPMIFKEGLTIPLYKGGDKDKLDTDCYRGITLQSVLCKVYETVILDRTREYFNNHIKFSSLQGACCKGVSSINSSFALHETICHNVSMGNEVFAIYFDTRKAFDTVWIEGLFYKLIKAGIKGKLWRLLFLSYDRCRSKVFVNNVLSTWFYILQGVRQGALWSMLLYIAFINELMCVIQDSGLGCQVNDISCSCIGYADDLAILTLHKASAQRIIDFMYRYSCKWRFSFHPGKCAVLVFGTGGHDADCTFNLGVEAIKQKQHYTHLGIVNRTDGKISIHEINEHLAKCRRAFYSVVGSNLFKTMLSPVALSKIYWSVVIPRLLSGAEVKFYSDTEIERYEHFHRSFAKDIQQLPVNTPNPAALAPLGWRSIRSQIDYIKLMFIQRILSLSPMSVYRMLFIIRFIFCQFAEVYPQLSPVSQIIDICHKYNILDSVQNIVEGGTVPSKECWKKMCSNVINEYELSRWRLDLKFYFKLVDFRVVLLNISRICWWDMAKADMSLKKSCIVIMRLLTGVNILRINTDHDLDRNQRVCLQCSLSEVENNYHFIMRCSRYAVIRRQLYERIRMNVKPVTLEHWQHLSEQMQFLILLGLEYPLLKDDLFKIRRLSCISIHTMYRKRQTAV